MFVLPVAATGPRQPPAIVLKKPDQLSDFQALPMSLPLPCNTSFKGGAEQREVPTAAS
jgi:hypothetical protein